MPVILSTRDTADLLGIARWRVSRLFEDGTLPEPARLAGRRAIPREMLPTIIDAMRARGWMPSNTKRGAVASV